VTGSRSETFDPTGGSEKFFLKIRKYDMIFGFAAWRTRVGAVSRLAPFRTLALNRSNFPDRFPRSNHERQFSVNTKT